MIAATQICSRMKCIKRVSCGLLVLFAAYILFLTPCFADDSSDDNTGRDDQQVFHLSDNLDLISTLKFQYDKPRIVIKAVYPQLAGDTDDDDNNADDNESPNDSFNQQVWDLVQQSIADFKMRVNDNASQQQSFKKIRNDFYIDYDAAFVRPRQTPIISIRFTTQGVITGLAHPYHQYFVLNYDLKNNQEIKLSDLFIADSDYLIVLSNYCASKLDRTLHKKFIANGTAAKEENFKNWNIKANGIMITFDEAQVAPRYYGPQTVLVPYAVLKQILSPDSALARCGETKKRCMRNLLLTGCFIDEASNTTRINSNYSRLNPVLSQR